MPITNSQGQFNVGRDLSIVLQGPSGRVQLDNIISFDVKGEYDQIKVKRLDGVVLLAELPWGWSGSITLERGSPSVDLLFAQMEATWLTGGSYQVSQLFTYVIETDGSTSTFAYDNVALNYADAGTWKGDTSVPIKITFQANRRRSV